MGDLAGQTAVVTGAARGIGFAICQKLASRGADIVILDVLADEAASSAEKIAVEYGVNSIGLDVDVTDEDSVDTAVDRIKGEFGRFDILVDGRLVASGSSSPK